MKTHARAVVIGGGIVGCSVLYHLTGAGWTDICLIERSELTSGSTWHAAGGFHTLNADTNMAALQGYTIRLYRELERITGQSCGLHHVGGITIATDRDRMDYLVAERAKHRYMGLDTEIVGPEEIARLSLAYAESAYVELEGRLNHTIGHRIPLIVYASHSDFEQTNVLPFVPPEGILGVTEYLKRRVTLPFRGRSQAERSLPMGAGVLLLRAGLHWLVRAASLSFRRFHIHVSAMCLRP